jgi:cyclopropane fatty-acyl-phospholipid synthase-like methyltransferase
VLSIHAAREHAAQQGLDIDYRVALAVTFDTDESFDAVMAVDVLEHVEDLDATALRQTERHVCLFVWQRLVAASGRVARSRRGVTGSSVGRLGRRPWT